ncbi:MAG: DUF4198 domain-containing protein [Proteobacteria bacterium]|nr:DUF4198 domain-containing protein [Pseudomonadota bacterium]
MKTLFKPIRPLSLVTGLLIALTGAASALSHELWIEAEAYQVSPNAQVVARFMNGEMFEGIKIGWFATRSARFEYALGGKVTRIAPRMGDNPALVTDAPGEGLMVVAYETTPDRVTYREWDKFLAFTEHKDFRGAAALHDARGLPREPFVEAYTRHVKALIGIGGAAGADRAMGLETEFVARANPYTDDLGAGFPVQLFYRGAPRADAQVEIFDRDPGGAVTVTLARTDAQGRATIPVTPGHTYLLDAVVLRPAPKGGVPVWETLWAGLTFAVPG